MRHLTSTFITLSVLISGFALALPAFASAQTVTCNLNATTANFASQVSAATAGQTICLASGNYGTWSGTNKAITVKAASGATPTMKINFGSGASNFTLDGMSGMGGSVSGSASNITIKNSQFTSEVDVSGNGTGRIFDGNTHNDISGSATANRFLVEGPVIIRNSHFEGGGSDGIRLGASVPSGSVVIEHNVFLNIRDDGSGNHTDNIQWYGGNNAIVRGNLFKQTIDGETQVMGAFDGTSGNVIEDNVIDVTGRNWGVELYADNGSIVRHNTVVYHPANPCFFNLPCGFIDFNHKSGDPAGQSEQAYDNIATEITLNPSSAVTRRDHNMVRQNAGSGDFIGNPIFVGGTSPSTYEGYALAAGSPGKNAASDGLDVGIRVSGGGGGDTTPPSTPTGLTATAISSSQINLSWTASTDNVGVTGYQIYRGGTLLTTVTGTSYNNTGLTPSTAYSYYVRATDAAGNFSGNSNTASATTQAPPPPDTTPPSTPTNLTATAVSSSQINLSWTASTDNVGVTGYKIFRGGVQVGTSATNSYSDSGLIPSTAYSYYVSAYDAAGNNSGNSATASATTPSGPPPSVTYVRDSDMADRTGTNNDAYTSFQVSGSNPAIIITAALNSSTGNVSSIALSNGLTGGTPYRCKQQRNGTTDLEIWAIPAPSGTGTITVNYSVTADHQSNAALFNNVSQTNPCSTADSVSLSGSTSPLSVTPTNVTSSDMVVYGGAQTVAGDAPHATSGTELFFGNSTGANLAVGYRLGSGAVSVTWGVTASSEAVVATRVVAAGGTSAKFAINDRVQVTGSGGGLNVRATPSTSGTLLATQPDGTLGTVIGGPTVADGYTWWNINYDTGADGWSVETYLTKVTGGDTIPPSTPTGLTATAISSSQINLSWTASTDNVGVTGYKIFRGGTLLTTVTGTSYSNTGLSPSTAYSYYVSAYDAVGNNSGNSNTASATTQAGNPVPTATLSANPTSITSGQSSTLTWSSTNATSCTGTGFTASGTSGSTSVSPTVTTTYSITCTGAGGTSAPASATVTVSGGGGGTCNLNATTANFASQVSAATAGQTICLASGNYGTWSGTNKAITVTKQSGATPTMKINFGSGASNFTLDGMSGMGGSVSGSASNITIKNSQFTSEVDVSGNGTGRIFDGNTHNDISGSATANRFLVEGPVIIRNSHFEGGGSDGIRLGASVPSGSVVIEHNVFLNIRDDGSGNHTDNIQWYGGNNAIVRGNLFKQTIDGETQVMGAFDGTSGNVIEDNVIDVTGRNWGVELYADNGSIVRHNTVVYHPANPCFFNLPCGFIDFNHKSGDPAGQSEQAYDNIATEITLNPSSAVTRRDHNMVRQNAGSGNFIGNPIFVGGTSPSTYEGYALAAGSPGKNAASDDLDVGIRVSGGGGGDTTPPSTPTNLTATAISSSQINLSWSASTDNVGVTGYKIFRDGVQVGTSATNSFSNTGISASTVYSYTVSATDAAGNNSAASNASSAITSSGGPQSIAVGSRVVTTANLNVRQSASPSATKLGTESIGALGTVIGGPTSAGGYTWWQINYDNGISGWSISTYLLPAAANASPAVGMAAPTKGNLTLIQQLLQQVQALSLQLQTLQAQLAGAGAAVGN